jgi:hypothetical protein
MPFFSHELPASPRQREEVISLVAELAPVGEGYEPLCFCLLCAPMSVEIMRREEGK